MSERVYPPGNDLILPDPELVASLEGANFVVFDRPAIKLGAILEASSAVPPLRPALALDSIVAAATVPERPAFRLDMRASGESARPQARSAYRLAMRASGTSARPSSKPGLSVVRTSVALVHRAGGNAVTETAVGGRTDWTNDANATGRRNGTVAGFAGNALGARGGQLELDYANLPNKAALAISSVLLHFFVEVAGTTLNNADVRLGYLLAGSTFTPLETITGNVASLTTPRTFDISAAVGGSWTTLDGLRTSILAEAALAEIWTASVDAVELEVVAESIV